MHDNQVSVLLLSLTIFLGILIFVDLPTDMILGVAIPVVVLCLALAMVARFWRHHQRLLRTKMAGEGQQPRKHQNSTDIEMTTSPMYLLRLPSHKGKGGAFLRYSLFIPKSLTISLKRLKMGKVIGAGAGGIVYKGTMDKSVPVAIKKINSYFISQDTASWFNESEVLCRLRHPNCVAFYGFSFDNSDFMFIQELCYGNLREPLRVSPDAVRARAAELMLQISAGIAYLHDMNIIHRDIKPENILLSNPDVRVATMKLADFGMSKISTGTAEEPSTMLTGGIGTGVIDDLVLECFAMCLLLPDRPFYVCAPVSKQCLTWRQSWSSGGKESARACQTSADTWMV
jgi:serine/threonine protein kinase